MEIQRFAEKDGKLFAMKQIEKRKLAKDKKEYQAFVERELLRKIEHPGIIIDEIRQYYEGL